MAVRMALLISVLIACLQLSILHCEAIEDWNRFDCFPEKENPSEAECKARKCLWMAKPSGAKKVMPLCFYNQSINYGYEVTSGTKDIKTKNGFIVNLTRSNTLPTGTGIFKNAITAPSVTVERHTTAQFRITIRDSKKPRFEVPAGSKFYIPKNQDSPRRLYNLAKNNKNGFSFSVFRPGESGNPIFDTGVGAMVLSDQYLQISAKLDTTFCYGFGEHEDESFVMNFNWTKLGMFSRDQPPSKGANLYGVHPFYMCIENSGKAHGVLLLNSNAMDVTLQPTPAITFRTIGGVLDFFFFLGPTPADVIRQYTGLIGRPFMPPYWSLGFQLCRYDYGSLDVVKKTVERMSKYDIPQDVQYGDIDYMERQLDFTYSRKTYNGLPEYVRELKKKGVRYITILDPAISANETAGQYRPYDLGEKMSIWIKDHTGTNALFGKVWPDLPNITVDETKDWDYQVKHYRAHAVFPDFTHPNISDYWGRLIIDFHKTIEFDGIWNDMNEPASFVPGSVNGCPDNALEKPPYKPGILGSTLADKTICMSAKHWNGEVEYNMHSLFGWSQTESTLIAAEKATGKRSLVISRSTYPSSGKFSGHWLGDNYSGWSQMKMSVIGMLDFGFFGIPYIGADICGFFKDTKEDLCQVWMALGAFYPFSRNHNGKSYKEQDPAVFGEKFAKKARSILRTRYNLLPYLYTMFHEAHKTGSPIVRPLFYEFVTDRNTWTIDEQFMWGNALLVTPILRKDQNVSLTAYVPKARMFNYFTGSEVAQSSRGKKSTFKVSNSTQIFLHVRGGTIMATQDPANNTMFSRRNPMGLIIALDENSKASGILYWDDGESKDSMIKNQYQMLDFSAEKNSLKISLRTNGYKDAGNFNFEHLTVYGMKATSGKDYKYIANNDVEMKGAKGKSNDKNVLKITGLKLPLNKAHSIKWYLEKPNTHSGSPGIAQNLPVLLLCATVAVVLNGLRKIPA